MLLFVVLLLLLLQPPAVTGGLLLLFCVLPLPEHCESLDRAPAETPRVGPTGDWLQATANNDTSDNREIVRFICASQLGGSPMKAVRYRGSKGSSAHSDFETLLVLFFSLAIGASTE